MKNLTILIFLMTTMIACVTPGPPKPVSLFNGVDLTGWHADVPAMDKNVDTLNPFIVRDSMLVCIGTPAGHIITDSVYQNYRIVAEYRLVGVPGNSGLMIHVSTPRIIDQMFPKSIEVQLKHEKAGDFWLIGEDITVPDMEARRGPKEKWGVTDNDERHIFKLTDGSEKPAGEWNKLVVECVADTIKVWVNNALVNYGTNCTTTHGQIAIQSEESVFEFRKLELTPIAIITKTE